MRQGPDSSAGRLGGNKERWYSDSSVRIMMRFPVSMANLNSPHADESFGVFYRLLSSVLVAGIGEDRRYSQQDQDEQDSQGSKDHETKGQC